MVLHYIQIDPPSIVVEEVEDFLATDNLFIEHFNAFLAQPGFSEPLWFNRDTGGFEVVTGAKKELAKQLKAAIISQKPTPKIYRVVKNHSFINIPLIPIEDTESCLTSKEISTSYSVTTLNKEQAIHWVKAERVPAFLQSELYSEYRLAKLVSQAKVTGENGQHLLMKIDRKRKPKKNQNEENGQGLMKPKDELMSNMFVCMGETLTTDTEAWYVAAKLADETATSFSNGTSGIASPSRPNSARPRSAYTAFKRKEQGSWHQQYTNSRYSPSNRQSDSGVSSNNSLCSSRSLVSKGFNVLNPVGSNTWSSPVYASHAVSKQNNRDILPGLGKLHKSPAVDDKESVIQTCDASNISEHPALQNIATDDSEQSTSGANLTCRSVDHLASVIVHTVLKHVIADMMGLEMKKVELISEIRNIVPNDKFSHMSLDMLKQLIVKIDENKEEETMTEKAKSVKEESDVESLLDSDDDFDDAGDGLQKHSKKMYTLDNMKGIDQFKFFLKNTTGEKNWNLWIDIDKSRLLVDSYEIQMFINKMKETYFLPGAHFKLSSEQKLLLGLASSSSWTIENLLNIQHKVAESLVLYWAPRFLLQQILKRNLGSCSRFFKSLNQLPPDPPLRTSTPPLLLRRPKSCQPCLQRTQELVNRVEKTPLSTTPQVGMRRTYSAQVLRKALPYITGKPKTDLKKKTHCKSLWPKIDLRSGVFSHPERSVSALACSPSSRGYDKQSEAGNINMFNDSHLDSLIRTLHHEKETGQYFQHFLEKVGDKKWIDNLKFWREIQEYHQIIAERVDQKAVSRKAKAIYFTYVMSSSPHDILCDETARDSVSHCLEPPFEDLFDPAEEYALMVLAIAWQQMLEEDRKTYNKVEQIEVTRHLETNASQLLHLQKRGLIKKRSDSPDEFEANEDPVYDESILEKIPEDFQGYTLEKLIQNRLELEHFRKFLADNYASIDLMCWMDIEAQRRIPQNEEEKRERKEKDIKTNYLNKKYFFGPNSPAGKGGQSKVIAIAGGKRSLLENRLSSAVLLVIQKYVRDRLEKKWMPLFITTTDFCYRQKPPPHMEDVVDDVLIQKRKRSQAVLKMLESRWISSSKEIITFRKGLLNQVTSIMFRHYVSIKGENLENDVLFWLEVQHFKRMYHAHADDPSILRKVNSIINCFIESQIPPSLQINVPQEVAEMILEHKYERSPYLFREAQLCVFRMLFNHWDGFCKFRSNMSDKKVMATLEHHRKHARAKWRGKQKSAEGLKRKSSSEMGLDSDDEDHLHVHHHHDNSEADLNEIDGDKISWTYSCYMQGLEQEDVLNNSDETTFSSLFTDRDSVIVS